MHLAKSSLLALAFACLAAPAVVPAQSGPPDLPFNLVPYLPHDVFNPIPGATGTQGPMDSFSWQTFVALNWQASEKENGVPDGSLKIGGQNKGGYYPNGMRNSPVVWETYEDTNDVFRPGGSPPKPFSTKAGHVLFDDTEAFTTSPLNDQNSNHVYYEVRFNDVEVDYITKNKLYLKADQKNVNFPAGDSSTKQVGSIHVKAAWKILNLNGPGQKDDPKRFYTAQAQILPQGGKPPYTATVGLVGLHIVHKTVGRPEWIWSTFEHVDNDPDLPAQGQPIAAGTYSFTNASCPVDKCPPNQQVPTDSTTPVQVLRVTPINPSTVALNQQWQAALRAWNPNTVWQYYQLVSTQWPAAPENKKIFGGPEPAFLANSVIETYFQGPSPKNPSGSNPPHSCMDCHGMFAQKFDFNFQLNKAFPHSSKAAVPGIFVPPGMFVPERPKEKE